MKDIVGVNNRAFEFAARGGGQVMDLKGELPGLFTPGEEVVAYRDLDELKDQIGYYLAHPDEARAIGDNAMKRALKDHTLRHRIEEILTVVEHRFGKRGCASRGMAELPEARAGRGESPDRTDSIMTDSLATGLCCIECGGAHPLGYTLQCPTCGGLLELIYDEASLRTLGAGAFTGSGLWRYAPVLPIVDPAHRVSLGEGQTPLLECPRLARELGVRRLLVKFEGANPTGTVKDRSSATAVSAALQFGFGVTSVVSSGNAGSSIAAYSARAGLPSLIFCYERASAPKMLHMAATASDLVIYKGVYDDLITLWDRLAEERLFFDGGASRNPYKHEGKKTIAYEIAEGLGWRAPDLVVAPVAVGETFIAASRGFAEMERLGLIARRPIMAAAQAARANAVV